MEEIGQEQRSTLSALRLCCCFKPNELVINICSCPPVSCSILLGLSPARCSAEKYLRGKTLLNFVKTDWHVIDTHVWDLFPFDDPHILISICVRGTGKHARYKFIQHRALERRPQIWDVSLSPIHFGKKRKEPNNMFLIAPTAGTDWACVWQLRPPCL